MKINLFSHKCISVVAFVRIRGNHRRESSVFCLSNAATVTRIPIGRLSANHSTPRSLVTRRMAIPWNSLGAMSFTRTQDVFGNKLRLLKFQSQFKRTARSKYGADD